MLARWSVVLLGDVRAIIWDAWCDFGNDFYRSSLSTCLTLSREGMKAGGYCIEDAIIEVREVHGVPYTIDRS